MHTLAGPAPGCDIFFFFFLQKQRGNISQAASEVHPWANPVSTCLSSKNSPRPFGGDFILVASGQNGVPDRDTTHTHPPTPRGPLQPDR